MIAVYFSLSRQLVFVAKNNPYAAAERVGIRPKFDTLALLHSQRSLP